MLAGQGLRGRARAGRRVLEAARLAVDHAGTLVDARFARATHRVERHTRDAVVVSAGSLDGRAIADALHGAELVVAVVCTLGPRLDDRVSALLPVDPLLALAFDGLGSAGCEYLAGELYGEIEQQAAAAGTRVTGPLAPGMIGWPLPDAHHQLFALVDPAAAGVTLAAGGQMLPRKTLAFVVGVGDRVSARPACPACGVRDRCKFRPNHG